jgi:hypothetical protein
VAGRALGIYKARGPRTTWQQDAVLPCAACWRAHMASVALTTLSTAF